ncbi:hypothetical protein SAMN06265349_103264 [Flavobacterium resistens]|uniref:Beta-carotene 15,15'-monooxygenase n=1 Tax=Flavobacterium resistens TaxID=443612 RepID=A0A521DHJ6_9FLAO|nr:hypothetical protein [Flavobacterium resistens]MRX68723.1 hypothetical protein [Flavobacterium resistens]SMO71055.1 hypothetical protein SAMN06265349_103264 [Flavobacterium resistens]
MKSTLAQIENIKNNGYSLDFSNVFDHAFENYKKIALYSALIIFLVFVIFGVGAMVTIGAIYGLEHAPKIIEESMKPSKLTLESALISTVGVSLITALFAPFAAGFFKMADAADKDSEFKVSGMFHYYKAPYFIQLFVATLIISVVNNIIANSLESTGYIFLGAGISIFINYFMYFTVPLIVFGNLKAIDAIKGSITLVTKNPLLIFGLFILGMIGSIVGVVACGVGLFFTVVFNTSLIYATYCGIFTMEQEEDSIDTIGQSDL